ncbi:MAG: tail fiber protein [Candidatus Thiodiazotropha sp.]
MNFTKGYLAKGIAGLLSAAGVLTATPIQACSSEPFIGSVCITAASFCPAGTYIEANGQILQISQYQALFSLLGNYYGGNGTSTFAVPDMRGRTPVGVGTGNGLNPVPYAMQRGVEFTTLSVQQIPAHSHAATFVPTTGSSSVLASTNQATKPQAAAGDYIASNNPLGGSPKFIPEVDAGTGVALGGVSSGGGTVQVGNTGGGNSFASYPPQQALKYCIAYNGDYPSRP